MTKNSFSRRAVLAGIAGAGLVATQRPGTLWAAEDALDPRVAEIVRTTLGIDTHHHVDVPLTDSGTPAPPPDLEIAGEMRRLGLSAVGMTFAAAERYERKSLAITANAPFSAWDEVFPDKAMTVAAVDRLVHHSTILEMNVDSYRRRPH